MSTRNSANGLPFDDECAGKLAGKTGRSASELPACDHPSVIGIENKLPVLIDHVLPDVSRAEFLCKGLKHPANVIEI
jgi:hypothetical protein